MTLTHLIYQEPTGDTYRRLLDWCARTAQRSLLVRRRTIDLDGSAQSLLEQLQPYDDKP